MSEVNVSIIGQTIKSFRRMTQAELDAEGWDDYHKTAFVLELGNGLKVYASQDDEGNGPGTLFWNHKGKCLMIMPNEAA